jgi:hypothetical protein
VPGKKTTIVFAIGVVVIAAVGGTIGVLMARHGAMRVSGSVTAEGTSIGRFSFEPNDCASGAAFVPSFLGADLRAQGAFGLRVAGSGDTARLWVFSQGGKQGSLTIDKPSCSQWDVAVDWAHQTVNRVNTVNGHVRVNCKAGGGTVKADVRFERCAQ